MARGFTHAAAVMSLLGLVAPGTAWAEDWKFAIEEIPGSIMDSDAQAFKTRIAAATGGDVTVTIYPLGSLGTPSEVAPRSTWPFSSAVCSSIPVS